MAELHPSKAAAAKPCLTQGLARLLDPALVNEHDPGEALRQLTRLVAETLGITRVSVWLLNAEQNRMTCAESYDVTSLSHESGASISARAHGPLFHRLCDPGLAAGGNQDLFEGHPFAQGPYLGRHALRHLLCARIATPDRTLGLLWLEGGGSVETVTPEVAAYLRGTCSIIQGLIGCGARRLADESRSTANRRLHQIIEFLPDATFVIDDSGIVVAWNRAMAKLTGCPRERILGHGQSSYSKVIYGSPRRMLIDIALNPLEGGAELYPLFEKQGDTVVAETQVPNFHGQPMATVWGSAHPLYDEQGHIIGAIESIRDVTARTRMERETETWKRRYEMVAAAAGQITYEHTPDTGEILWSSSSDFILGLQLAEVGGTAEAWFELMHPEDRPLVRAQLEEVRSNASPFVVEYRLRHTNGSYLWFRDNAYFTLNGSGQRCLIGMLTDITEMRTAQIALHEAHVKLEQRVQERTEELAVANQRLMEEIRQKESTQRNLESSEAKYRAMVNSLPQVVFEADLDGRLIRLNRQGYLSGGLSPADLARGCYLHEFIIPEQQELLRRNWERLLAGGEMGGTEYTVQRRDGSRFPVSSYAQVILGEGAARGITGFLIDETPRKRAQEALQRAHAELETRVRQRTAELAERNASLGDLLRRQEMNIGLAHRVLTLVNSRPPRHIPIDADRSLFVAAQLIPRQVEGGDHFLVRNGTGPDATATYVSLKDESGHEVGCILRSIITDLFHNALLGKPGHDGDLGRILTRLNAEICGSSLFQDGEFLTAVNLRLDRSTLRLDYLLAGHPPFLLIRAGQVRAVPGDEGAGINLPLGLLDNQSFTQGSLQLEAGDQLLLYTDGLLDAAAQIDGRSLSSRELPTFAQRVLDEEGPAPVGLFARRLFERLTGRSLQEARQKKGFPDDIGLVVAEIEASPRLYEDLLRPEDLPGLREARARLMDRITEEWKLHDIQVTQGRLQFVLEEALMNAWKHGNGCAPGKAIRVRRSYGNDACIEVIDEGTGFDWSAVANPTSYENRLKPSGRGLFMIRRFADEAHWHGCGNHLVLHFCSEQAFGPQASDNPLHDFDLWQES